MCAFRSAALSSSADGDERRRTHPPSYPDLGFLSLGLRESGCKFALSPPTVGRKAQICTLIHSNLVSQITNLVIAVEDQMHSIYKGMKSK